MHGEAVHERAKEVYEARTNNDDSSSQTMEYYKWSWPEGSKEGFVAGIREELAFQEDICLI